MAKVLLAKHNDMVKAIPPDRSDKPLRTSVLPRAIVVRSAGHLMSQGNKLNFQ
jgi:hypothetical protein